MIKLNDDQIRELKRSVKESRRGEGIPAAHIKRHLEKRIEGECRSAANSVAVFAAQQLEEEIGSKISVVHVYEHYRAWCQQRNVEPVLVGDLCRTLTTLGFVRIRTGGKICYQSVKIIYSNASNKHAS